MKLRVLWYSDFFVQSGFSRVAHELVRRLDAKGTYEFSVVGIGYTGQPAADPKSPYHDMAHIPVFPTTLSGDPRGERLLLEMAAHRDFDVLFMLANPWDVCRYGSSLRRLAKARGFRIVYYFPIEEACDPKWVHHAIGIADRPVAYTHFGADAVERAGGPKCQVVYHGVDTTVFRPPFDEDRVRYLRRVLWGVEDDTIVLLNVNRNQPRKDLPRTMLVADRLTQHQSRPVLLHLQTDIRDPAATWNLREVERNLANPDLRVVYGSRGLLDAQLAELYQAADALITTSLCEGWGLSTTEAMASALPVVAPNASVFPEIVGRDGLYGVLAQTRGIGMFPGQEMWFKLTDHDDMAYKIAKNIDTWRSQGLPADPRAWVTDHCDWEFIAGQWDGIFESVKEPPCLS